MKVEKENQKKVPTTLFQLLVLLVKNIIKSLPRRILFAILTGLAVLAVHTYLMVVKNEGFNLDTSSKILKYILMLRGSGGTGSAESFRLFNTSLFWMLVSGIFWAAVAQIRQVGFKVVFVKFIDNFVKLFSDIFQKPGAVTLSLFLGSILTGLAVGMISANPPVCILLSIFIFLSVGARETSILLLILYLGWCDLQRLFRVKHKRPFYIDIVSMVIRGVSIGLLLSAFMPYIRYGNIIQYAVLFVFAGLMILNMTRKSKPNLASFLFLFGSALLFFTTKGFADDGGWMESGGTLKGWMNSPGSWEAIKMGLKPALSALSIALGFVPILGDIKDIQEVLTGVDLITGEKLSVKDRLITAAAMLVPVVNGKMLRTGADVASEGLNLIAKHGDEAADIIRKSDDITDLARTGNKVSDLAGKSDNLSDLARAGNKASDLAGKSDEVTDLARAGNKASDLAGKSDDVTDLTRAGNKASDLAGKSDDAADITGAGNKASDLAGKSDDVADSAGAGNKASDLTRKSDDVADSAGTGEKAIDDTGTAPGKADSAAAGAGAKDADVPPAFKQTDFASTYEARIGQTPKDTNLKVGFDGVRGESKCALKPPPDPEIKKIFDDAGIDGIEYKNGVPDFSPVSEGQVEIDHMVGGIGNKGSNARRANFDQADQKLADQLNNSPELAKKFGMKPGEISADDIESYRKVKKLTWHEVNDTKTIQLVPSKINKTFGHLGGVGEINAGAFEPGGFAAN